MLKEIRHRYRVWKSNRREKKKEHRSSQWKAFRDHYVQAHSYCLGCNTTVNIQPHHILPYAMNPELELAASNLVSLCMDANECHLRIGHGGSFKAYNPLVLHHIDLLRLKPHARYEIEASAKLGRQPLHEK